MLWVGHVQGRNFCPTRGSFCQENQGVGWGVGGKSVVTNQCEAQAAIL